MEQVSEVKELEDMSPQEMAQFIRDFSRDAMVALNERREKENAAACVPLDEESAALAVESADIEARAQGVIERMASAEKVKRFEYDQLNMQEKTAEAQAKLAELEQIKAVPAKIEKRRLEIADRCREIEAEKKAILRRAGEDFKEASIALTRGSESGLASTLDAVRDALNTLEVQLGTALYQPAELTADDKTSEWRTLTRLYSGRVR